MRIRQRPAAFAIDLTRLHGRTVTSFYSNLVTRPTGRAVRMGVEQQLLELADASGPYLSILDFSQVNVLDYSCADEIVAKLLLRYVEEDRPLEVYFLARGLRDHHLESVEAVLERHRLLLAAEDPTGEPRLIGPSSSLEQMCWRVLVRHEQADVDEVAASSGLTSGAVMNALRRFIDSRVAVALPGELICSIPRLNHG